MFAICVGYDLKACCCPGGADAALWGGSNTPAAPPPVCCCCGSVYNVAGATPPSFANITCGILAIDMIFECEVIPECMSPVRRVEVSWTPKNPLDCWREPFSFPTGLISSGESMLIVYCKAVFGLLAVGDALLIICFFFLFGCGRGRIISHDWTSPLMKNGW